MDGAYSLTGKKILIVGATGLLGSELAPAFTAAGAEVSTSTSRTMGPGGHLDICKPESIDAAFLAKSFDVVVNCAAYTAVDDAEREYASAFLLNAEAVGLLAAASKRYNFKLVHISTDYVFGGVQGESPFRETDAVAPLGIYGLSKWHGELLLNAVSPARSLIVRTSWLHGVHGKNFIDTMLRLGQTQAKVKVVQDQIGSLTWAPWLAQALVALVAVDAQGVVHASSQGQASWYDVASEIFSRAKIDVAVEPVSTREFARPAPRPAFSVMSTDKLRSLVSMPPFTWQDSVLAHLQARGLATK
jgi:dTDP-4-dehydrorhamnose reductase